MAEWSSQVSGTDLSLAESLAGNRTAKSSLNLDLELGKLRLEVKFNIFYRGQLKM